MTTRTVSPKLVTEVETPLGQILLASDGAALTGVYFRKQDYFPPEASTWRRDPDLPLLRQAARELREYFYEDRTVFEIPLHFEGTPFQISVWEQIASIPFGATSTYGELARRIGRPSASRAVGAATGRNPIGIVVPCHRIVGTDGSLTGYAGGMERKVALLKHERQGRTGGWLHFATPEQAESC